MRPLLLSMLFFGSFGCQDYTITLDVDNVEEPVPGSISGRVCDPSGAQWLSDALVYTNIFNDEGVIIDVRKAYTDRDGYWTLDDLQPDREYQIYIQFGTQLVWQRKIFVADGEAVEIDEPRCFDPLALNIAVITGDYDDMQLMLLNMGFANYTLVDGTDPGAISAWLREPTNLEPYDVIFFNGGIEEKGIIWDYNPANELPGIIAANLKQYVWDGGSVYASDWSYDVIESVWPDSIDFLGDDGTPDAAQLGEYDLVDAIVTDESLWNFLGQDRVEIGYDLPVWPPITSVEPYVSIHLTGTVHYREGRDIYTLASVPLLASFSGGDGRVVFSTFRVAANQSETTALIFQYMMYNVSN